MKTYSLSALLAGLVLGLAACGSQPDRPPATPVPNTALPEATIVPNAPPASAAASIAPPTANAQSFDWRLPPNMPKPVVPAENPMTEAKFQLGRYLFYDKRLSGNGEQACASCHIQKLAFTDGRPTAVGSTGQVHPRNSQTLANVAYNATLTWANPVLIELEKQIPIPMFGEFPVELGITGKEDLVLDRFRKDARYAALFAGAFAGDPDPVSYKNIVYALATFSRGLISFNSPYDRYRATGDETLLSESAARGKRMFFSEDLECHHCHTSFNLTASTRTELTTFNETPFFNTGLYNIGGTGAYPQGNQGLKELTNDPEDMGKFRPPTLRNIALTAPYMHDGSMKTLDEVIRFYERGGRAIASGPLAGDGKLNPFKNGLVPGFKITDAQRADVIAFLDSLTDTDFINNPRYADPFAGGPP